MEKNKKEFITNELMKAGWIMQERKLYKHVTTPCHVYLRQTKVEDYKAKAQKGITPTGQAIKDLALNDELDVKEMKAQNNYVQNEDDKLFSQLESIKSIRSKDSSLVIAYDSEWYDTNPRKVLSYQYAWIEDDLLNELIILTIDNEKLTMDQCLGILFKHISIECYRWQEVRAYEICTGWIDGNPVLEKATGPEDDRGQYYFEKDVNGIYQPSKFKIRDNIALKKENFYHTVKTIYNFKGCYAKDVTLLCHTALVDITNFKKPDKENREFLYKLSAVQQGLVTMNPFKVCVTKADEYWCFHYINLSVRDTMCQAPAKNRSLETLGKALGIEKIPLKKEFKEKMNKLLLTNPVLYTEYASRDSVVTLLYANSIYGTNKKMCITLSSATAQAAKASIMKYMGLNSRDYDQIYRGMKKISNEVHTGSKIIKASTHMEAISIKAKDVLDVASKAYHGGYNAADGVNYVKHTTFDYDLNGAYAVAMSLIPDVMMSNPYDVMIQDRPLALDDVQITHNSVPMFIGFVEFEFPEECQACCIPIEADNCIIYPRTSPKGNPVAACGPELYLALKLGAKVHVVRGFKLNTLKRENGETSFSMRYAMKQLVIDRKKAQLVYGKDSLQQAIIKVLCTSFYGKIAQDVKHKRKWDAETKDMIDLRESSITNYVSAAMITSVIRATLIAAQNQILNKGYLFCSVTTDGFISDITEEELDKLDLYGFKNPLSNARMNLTDNKNNDIWQIKHAQDDLLSWTTRGNVSLYEEKENPFIYRDNSFSGVCAHAGLRSAFTNDSCKDRQWLLEQVISRTGKVKFCTNDWTTFKEIMFGKEFSTNEQERYISMNYDLKRKPVESTLKEVSITNGGLTYTIGTFTTVPYDTVEEFLRYREIAKNSKCLRTVEQLKAFFFKIQRKQTGKKNKRIVTQDLDWVILMACIRGYRQKLWDIPYLTNNKLTVQQKCDWINQFNNSTKYKFTRSSWDNCAKKDRTVDDSYHDLIKDMLEKMQNS